MTSLGDIPCLAGGDVTFDISNDAPTMAGADATFSIALRFPGTQAVLPDGRVVWSQNCTVNGLHPQTPLCPPTRSTRLITVRSPQAPASPKGTPFSRSRRLMVPTASSPMGNPSPKAPGTSVENSSMSGGRGVRAMAPTGVRGGPQSDV